MGKKILNASEMGKKGGLRTKETMPSDYYAQIGKKGRDSIKKNDPDFYKRLSAAGIKARNAKKPKKKESPLRVLSNLLTGRPN